jgi:hypothetical protein
MSAIAKRENEVKKKGLYFVNNSNGLTPKTGKYAPRLKNRIVCGIKALLLVVIHHRAIAIRKSSLVYLMA